MLSEEAERLINIISFPHLTQEGRRTVRNAYCFKREISDDEAATNTKILAAICKGR